MAPTPRMDLVPADRKVAAGSSGGRLNVEVAFYCTVEIYQKWKAASASCFELRFCKETYRETEKQQRKQRKCHLLTSFSKFIQGETVYLEISLEALPVHPGRQASIFVLCNTRRATPRGQGRSRHVVNNIFMTGLKSLMFITLKLCGVKEQGAIATFTERRKHLNSQKKLLTGVARGGRRPFWSRKRQIGKGISERNNNI